MRQFEQEIIVSEGGPTVLFAAVAQLVVESAQYLLDSPLLLHLPRPHRFLLADQQTFGENGVADFPEDLLLAAESLQVAVGAVSSVFDGVEGFQEGGWLGFPLGFGLGGVEEIADVVFVELGLSAEVCMYGR
jgi:hypothetical protein